MARSATPRYGKLSEVWGRDYSNQGGSKSQRDAASDAGSDLAVVRLEVASKAKLSTCLLLNQSAQCFTAGSRRYV